MPWEERSVTMMREQFVNEVPAGEKNKSQLCREYGISRVTGDKWLARLARHWEVRLWGCANPIWKGK